MLNSGAFQLMHVYSILYRTYIYKYYSNHIQTAMATEQLIQPPFYPNWRAAREDVAIDVGITRTDMLIMMDEMLNSVRDERKVDSAYSRLAARIVDSLLWKLFKLTVILLIISCTIIGIYCVYYFLIRDDVDNVFTRVGDFANQVIQTFIKLTALIEKIYDMLVDFGEGAEKVVHDMKTHVMNTEDKMDAIVLAMN